jgi:endonuclease/exonuclease/phosphatase family metal-dependent hydrolase
MRVVTLNLWNTGPEKDARAAQAAQLIAAVRPDLVFLTEVTPLSVLGPRLAQLTGLPYYALGKHSKQSTDMGLAILSRTPLTQVTTVDLPHAEGTSGYYVLDRLLLSATVLLDGQPVRVHTAHLNYRPDHGAIRQEQVATILRALGPGGRHIFGGDLNATPETAEVALFRQAGFVDAGPSAPTWAARNPKTHLLDLPLDRKIDYLLTRGLRAFDARVIVDQPVGDQWASDHFGLVADVVPAARLTAGQTVGIVAASALAVGATWFVVSTLRAPTRRHRSLGAPPALEAEIQRHEAELVRLPKERALLFDPDGTVVFRKDGRKRSIAFTPEELVLFKDRVFTHNHPPLKFTVRMAGVDACLTFEAGNSLSPKDVRVAIEHNLAEVRAITKAYVDDTERTLLHRLERPANGKWPSWQTVMRFYPGAIRHANTMRNIHLRSGRVQYRDACASTLHEAWTRVAETLDLKYERLVLP